MSTLHADDYTQLLEHPESLLSVIAIKQAALVIAHEDNQRLTFEVQKKCEEIVKLRKEHEELKTRATAFMKEYSANVLQLGDAKRHNAALLTLLQATSDPTLDPQKLIGLYFEALLLANRAVQSPIDQQAVVEAAKEASKLQPNKPKRSNPILRASKPAAKLSKDKKTMTISVPKGLDDEIWEYAKAIVKKPAKPRKK